MGMSERMCPLWAEFDSFAKVVNNFMKRVIFVEHQVLITSSEICFFQYKLYLKTIAMPFNPLLRNVVKWSDAL